MTGLAMKWLIGASSMVVAVATPLPAPAYEAVAVAGGGRSPARLCSTAPPAPARSFRPRTSRCAAAPHEETLIQVGPDKSVQNAVVYLADITKGKAWPAAAKTPELDNIQCHFEPHIQVIRAGGLDVVNSDPMLHNTHGYYGKRTAFNLALPNQGQRIPVELPRAGEVRIDCDAHGWMEGWIYVVDNPYYAITGADGKFTITDVPPGTTSWWRYQPFTGPMEQTVTVAAGKPSDLTIELKKK